MSKTAAERITELADLLRRKANEIRAKTEGVEANVDTTRNRRTGPQSKK